MKKKGSALIVAMMLIAGIGAVAFGIGRLLFIETTTATLYENGILAYYAAESGIEEGFLRYKFNRNAEIPLSTSAGWSLTSNNIFRETLNDNSIDTDSDKGFDTNTPLQLNQKSQQLFDLRMGYLGTDGKPWYGNDIGDTTDPLNLIPDGFLNKQETWHPNYYAGDYSGLRVTKDNSIKIDLTHIDFSTVYRLVAGFSFDKNDTANPWDQTTRCKALAEIKISVTDVTGTITKEYKELLNYNPALCEAQLGINKNKLLIYGGGGDTVSSTNNRYLYVYVHNLVDFFARAGDSLPVNSKNVTLTLKPLYYDATVLLFPISNNSVRCNETPNDAFCNTRGNIPSGPFTYISSRGYYGGVTRKITANIDRQSGTLYDLFDYVIFSE